jgi:lipid II:glycine glycyltransferase (peptidoglycan interpeptide bridge formation enzyme)
MTKLIDISPEQKDTYNALVTHPLQSYEWGEFRKKTGVTVVRKGIIQNEKLTSAFTVTIHKIPKTPFTIGYLPKGSLPTENLLEVLKTVGKEHNCIFIQLEPNIEKIENLKLKIKNLGLHNSHHPLFTKYTFVLDLKKSEDELLASMHHKTRYNIKVAQKKGVIVQENNTLQAFKEYLRLTDETTTRQKFYAHTHTYHKLQWETLSHTSSDNQLSSHLLTANFEKDTLVSWILFKFKDTLYYPYGASSSTHRDKMASNLIMWEAIKFGKKSGCTAFDMWGALSDTPDTKDPWYGFHRFKQNYGAKHTEFVGSYDFILNPALYKTYQALDIARWGILRLKKKFT